MMKPEWDLSAATAACRQTPKLELVTGAKESNLPSVCVNVGKIDSVAKESLQALQARNVRRPVLFARGHAMVYVAADTMQRSGIVRVEEPYLLVELERSADFYKEGKKGPCSARPSSELAKAILARPQREWRFPALDGVVSGPVLRRDWTVMTEPGYDADLRLYHAPAGKLDLSAVPDRPTQEQCCDAVRVIDDVIAEFPWVGKADRSNYMGLLLTPLLRHRAAGGVPIALLDSPKMGNGKTLLAEILGLVHAGLPPAMWTPPAGENWEKIVTTILLGGAPITVFDNLEGTLRSPLLAKVVTADEHADRQFHTQKTLVMRNRTVFIVTGNNIKLAGDLGRRCYRVRLDAQVSRPWERRAFKHPALKDYVRHQRGAILAALVTMARGWVAAGTPKLRTNELGGGFENWSRTVGRILAYAGVEGFLANQDAMYEEADTAESQWAAFLEALLERFPQGFKIGALIHAVESGSLPKDVLPEDTEFVKPESVKIAGLFRRRVQTRFGPRGLFLDNAQRKGSPTLWFVRMATKKR